MSVPRLRIYRYRYDTCLVLNTRVLSLGVFTDQNGVDIVVGSLVTLDGDTWTDVGEKGEGSSQSQVKGNVTFSDYPVSALFPEKQSMLCMEMIRNCTHWG